MAHKFKQLYCWLIRTLLFFLPDAPIFMRLRGLMYKPALKSVGKNFQVAHNVQIVCGDGLEIGDNVYIAYNCIFIASKDVYIGDNVIFGPMCLVVCDNHIIEKGSFRSGRCTYRPIYIGDNSWVGGHCVILPGAGLPENSILAANSTLGKALDGVQCVYGGGTMAKFIKKIDC